MPGARGLHPAPAGAARGAPAGAVPQRPQHLPAEPGHGPAPPHHRGPAEAPHGRPVPGHAAAAPPSAPRDVTSASRCVAVSGAKPRRSRGGGGGGRGGRSRGEGRKVTWRGRIFRSSPGPHRSSPGAAMANHLRFWGRTVMVQNGNVEAAYGVLNRLLAQDGLVDTVRRGRYYEKPCRRRQRSAFEASRRVYGAEMGRKIAFLARSNRLDPWLGC
ncbi:small ribosomal subunit protein bS21m [Lathamus discolor]|uniref:small ribosomal subunit protein bS21m n=1 Tax=Lathamus discolor TaxID=678569 RepID=UPI0032B7D0B2